MRWGETPHGEQGFFFVFFLIYIYIERVIYTHPVAYCSLQTLTHFQNLVPVPKISHPHTYYSKHTHAPRYPSAFCSLLHLHCLLVLTPVPSFKLSVHSLSLVVLLLLSLQLSHCHSTQLTHCILHCHCPLQGILKSLCRLSLCQVELAVSSLSSPTDFQ